MSSGDASDDPGAVFQSSLRTLLGQWLSSGPKPLDPDDLPRAWIREALRRLFRDDPDSALFPAVREVTHELEAQIVDALGPDGVTVMDKALFQEIVRVIDEEIPP